MVYTRVPQIWRTTALSLTPTLIKLTYLGFSRDPEPLDELAKVRLIRVDIGPPD